MKYIKNFYKTSCWLIFCWLNYETFRQLQQAANIGDSYDVILTRSNAVAPYPRVERSAKCLSSCGLHCLVVGWDRDKRHSFTEKREGFDIIRAKFSGQFGGGIRNIPGLFRWNLFLLALHLKLKPKVIHAYDFDTVMPALIAKIFINCKVVYDIADWYSISRKVGYLRRLFDEAERWVCRKVDLVILPHEARTQQLGFIPRKCLVIYNSPEDHMNSLVEIKQEGNGYFVYVGVLQPDRGLEQIVETTSALGVKLILAGFGPLEVYCKEVSAARPNIEFLGQIPHKRTLELEKNAIAIIALYDPTFPNNRLAAPNKLYEAMMLGRPLITTKGTLVGDIVERERIGIAVTYGDIQELRQALSRLINNPAERTEMGQRARVLYETRYSCDMQCQKLRQAYQELCSEPLRNLVRGGR